MTAHQRGKPNANSDPLVPESGPRDGHDRMIPMINIVFLLLAFFLIAGTLRFSGGPGIIPPEASGGGIIRRDNPVLTITADGGLFLDGESVEIGRAAEAARVRLAAAPGEMLYIKAGRETPVSLVLPVMKTLRDGGIGSIRMITIKTSPPQ